MLKSLRWLIKLAIIWGFLFPFWSCVVKSLKVLLLLGAFSFRRRKLCVWAIVLLW